MENHPPKYKVTHADGSPLPEGEPYFVLRAQDQATYNTLLFYRGTLLANGYSEVG